MHGEAKLLLKFLDGSDNRYIIPVYQRNYDWRPKQCEQLFNDLVQIIKKDRKTHFFGSIVTPSANKGGMLELVFKKARQMTEYSSTPVGSSCCGLQLYRNLLFDHW